MDCQVVTNQNNNTSNIEKVKIENTDFSIIEASYYWELRSQNDDVKNVYHNWDE